MARKTKAFLSEEGGTAQAVTEGAARKNNRASFVYHEADTVYILIV